MKEHLKEFIDKSKTPSVRGLRILLEYFYALEVFDPILLSQIRIVSVFGSARLHPGTPEYKDAKNLGALLYRRGYAVVTGASYGIMQAANEGVAEGIIEDLLKTKKFKSAKQVLTSPEYEDLLRKCSVGLKISLPFEPHNNPFVGVNATFHYFMVRKFFFGTLSSAFIACEGGWGTRDELFEILTLVQTGKAPLMPIIYITPDPEHIKMDLEYTIKKGYISPEDVGLLEITDDIKKAVASIDRFYSVVDTISYEKEKTIEVNLSRELTAQDKKMVKSLVSKDMSTIFKDVSFEKKKFILSGFTYKSYGYLRRIIDELSGK